MLIAMSKLCFNFLYLLSTKHLTMKKLILFITVLSSLLASGQNKYEVEILRLEVLKYRTVYAGTPTIRKDSIYIAQKIPNKILEEYLFENQAFSKFLVEAEEITQEEADEIFGKGSEKTFAISKPADSLWTQEYFPGLKVKLFQSVKGRFEPYHVFTFSKPFFRDDYKYALVFLGSRNEGSVMSIYKRTEKGWVLYKTIQLYLV